MPKRQKDNQEESSLQVPEVPVLRYSHPRVLLIDIEDEATNLLKDKGYNVSTGTFGRPYEVQKADAYTPVICSYELPDFLLEEEIIIINLEPPSSTDGPEGEKHTTVGEKDWWANCSLGIVDPRPRAMAMNMNDFDRILSAGGIFIVFTWNTFKQDLIWATGEDAKYYGRRGNYHSDGKPINFDNLSFLSYTNSNVVFSSEAGKSMGLVHPDDDFGAIINKILSSHIKTESYYNCIVSSKKGWIPLMKSKYENMVGAGAMIEVGDKRGFIFFFPQLSDKPHFIYKMITQVLPVLSPLTFPELNSVMWLDKEEYELPKIKKLNKEITDVYNESERKVAALQRVIQEEKDANSYLFALLRETGKPLVEAVKKTLAVIGFENVVDVDEEMEAVGDNSPRDEDLQILDESPALLVEVKGIGRCPSDEEALTVEKYLPTRMRQWERTDVRGLTIINHERHLPGLERQKEAFREKILENAERRDLGLITAWDLYRLVRNYVNLG